MDVSGNSNLDLVHGSWLITSSDYQGLIFYARNRANRPYFITSSNGGDTWDQNWTQLSVDISNGISSISLSPDNPNHPLNGYHLICGSKHGVRRGRLDVYLSTDPAGNSWTRVLELNLIPWNMPKYEENAGPTIFQSRDGSKVHLLFTGRGGSKLKYYIIDAYKLCDVDAATGSNISIGHNHMNFAENGAVRIFDPSGRCVFTSRNTSVSNASIDKHLKKFSTGIYYAHIRRTAGLSSIRKFVVE
ncbi:MAG: T9SS type A sorting domain-containing protein [Chitinivibrionales bacterium]|nr:T9SS type A sorting domain-containing protein [Chitinivibrionales bacterium]